MVLVRRLAYVASLLLVPACGQSLNKAPPVVTEDLAGTTSGGKDFAMVDAAPSAIIDMAGFNQAGAPTIVITSPAAGTEVHGDTLTVTATITSPTNTFIQASSVEVTVAPPGGLVASSPLTLTTTANVYSGSVTLPDIASGSRTFTVSASDVNGLKGSAQGTFVHDHGPILTFVAPSGTMPVKGTSSITVEIAVDDSLHPITDVSAVSAGIRSLGDITLTEVAGQSPFTVEATVNLKAYQNPVLDGNQLISAQAKNSANTIGMATQPLIVDNSGPLIVINTPQSSTTTFVSGVTPISATITDISGVDASSVVAVWGGNDALSVQLTNSASAPTVYTGTYDVRALGTSYVHPTLSVRANDTLGNQANVTDTFYVDNTRPWLTMDSRLNVRIGKFDSTDQLETCSALFAPIGSDVAVDGSTVQLAITLRARVEDHGNTEPGLKDEVWSGINESTVNIYVIQDDGTTPLAVDTDADGVCDDVNPLLVPTTDTVTMPGEALVVGMVPITGSGTANFVDEKGAPFAPLNGACGEYGTPNDSSPPPPLCTDAPLNVNIESITGFDEIFTLGPTNLPNVGCVGAQLDSQNRNLRGPICVITRAVDNTGNISVSYPLHLCIKDPANPTNCNGYSAVATHCTGVWNKVTQQLGTGGCTLPGAGATFTNGEVIETP